MSQLVEGKIPAKTDCPFRLECGEAEAGACGHMGEHHNVPYSCGYARLFDLMSKRNVRTN